MNKVIFLSIFSFTSTYAASYAQLDLEALVLQRGGSRAKTLVQQELTPQNGAILAQYKKQIKASQLVNRLGYEPALRVTLGGQGDIYGGFVRALVPAKWETTKTTNGSNLSFPFIDPSYAPEWSNGYKGIDHYSTHLVVVDAYFSQNIAPLWKDYFGFKYLVGTQYFNLPETNKLTLYSLYQTPPPFSRTTSVVNTYEASTTNNALMGALGFYFQIRPIQTFAFELIGYGGLGANYISSSTCLKGINDTVTRRFSSRKAIGASYSFISSVRVTYKPFEFFQISGSYEFLCLSGVAFAYRQMSYGVKATSDNQVSRTGSATFQGFSLRVGFLL